MNENTAMKDDSKYSPPPRRKRFCVVREELLAITDSILSSMILHQFLYWTGRGGRNDGWIWKSASELADHDLLGIRDERTVRRRLTDLIDLGYLERRRNPDNPMDNTPQYRVDVGRVIHDVEAAGYTLDGWTNHGVSDAPGQNDRTPRQNDRTPRQNDRTLPKSTIKDYKQRSSTSEGSKPEVDRQAIETDEYDTPAQKLLAMSQRAGVHLSIMQAENAWETLKDKLGGDDAWKYIKFKLADLDETDYPRRRKYEYLVGDKDIQDWREINGETQIGAHTATEFHHKPEPVPTPPSPPGEPVGAVEQDKTEQDWGEISERLYRLDLNVIERDAIDLIHPVASRDGALWLWSEMREVRSVMSGHVQAVANDLEFKIKWMEK